ncbi:MAG TPA: 7TM diverse intracellular signaling domain-containing protein [Ignavibacteriaceae bacterium]|nr:7TM diverse intracellular signaling domain-containing protein [Ignavibacteriaceae bacterium]
MKYSVIYTLFLYCIFIPHNFAQKQLILRDGINSYSVNSFIYTLFDSTKLLTIKEISSNYVSSEFKILSKEQTNLGYRSEAIWLRFTIRNESKKTNWLLSLNSSGIDKAILFTPLNNGRFKKDKAGLIFPREARENNSRFIVFQTNINSQETKTYYIRIESEKPIQLNLETWQPNMFFEKGQNEYIILGLFYGGLVMMAIYNLFLFFSIKDISYFLFSLFVSSVLYYQGNVDGIYIQYFTPDNPQYNLISANISAASVSFFGLLFVKEFLQLNKYSKFLNRLCLILIYSIGLDVLMIIILQVSSSIFTSPIGAIYIIFSFVAGVYCFKKGNKNAVFFLLASFFFLAGILFRVLNVFAIINESFLSEYGMQIGILIEMTILSFALGDRINSIKREEDLEKALIRSRIASDLHDEIGSNLSSISVSSQIIKKSAHLNSDEKNMLEEIILTARESADSIRDIIWFINPDHDNQEDLILKMRDTAAKMLNGIDYSFIMDKAGKINIKDLKIRKNLFLIYKEILNNIVKHSKATKVIISLEEKSNYIYLSIMDDGIGFDETEVVLGDGIKNLKQRAKAINGLLEIKSKPSFDTTITLTVKNN